jgi:hypothetical protein
LETKHPAHAGASWIPGGVHDVGIGTPTADASLFGPKSPQTGRMFPVVVTV